MTICMFYYYKNPNLIYFILLLTYLCNSYTIYNTYIFFSFAAYVTIIYYWIVKKKFNSVKVFKNGKNLLFYVFNI